MKAEKLNQTDIEFLTSKVKKTTLIYKVAFVSFIVMIPIAVFVAFESGFSWDTAFLIFAVIALYLSFHFNKIIVNNIRQDLKNDVKEMSQGTITESFTSYGKGYIVDEKNYIMDEFEEFEVGEIVLTEYVPISSTGLRIDKIDK